VRSATGMIWEKLHISLATSVTTQVKSRVTTAWRILETRVLLEPVVPEDLFDFTLWGELRVEDKRKLGGTGGGIIVIWCVAKEGEEGDGVICSSVAAPTVFLGLTGHKSRFGTKWSEISERKNVLAQDSKTTKYSPTWMTSFPCTGSQPSSSSLRAPCFSEK